MLPSTLIKISDSPENGKIRAIEIRRILIAHDLKQIRITTQRRFFEHDGDQPDGVGAEITGRIEYQLYEKDLVASNDKLCNPSNGLTVTQDGNGVWHDVNNAVVAAPTGMFDYFIKFATQPVSQHDIVVTVINTEDSVYHTWDK
jgi:hypothetical protein